MSAREAATARRWFPARFFLGQDPRYPVWFHSLEVFLLLGVPQLPLWFLFFRARRQFAAAARAAAAAANAPPTAGAALSVTRAPPLR